MITLKRRTRKRCSASGNSSMSFSWIIFLSCLGPRSLTMMSTDGGDPCFPTSIHV